jgi:phosphoglycolate phosphatase
VRIRAVVFDLDGTLIDGYEGIHEALSFAMTHLDLPVPERARVREMVGHGLETLLVRAAGPDLAAEGLRLFRQRYREVAVGGSRVLPGVDETLARLAGNGCVLAVASNKPQNFSRMILEAKGIAGRFAAIAGPDETHAPKPDPAMLRSLLAAMDAESGETACVGDMEVDVEFARAGGCRAVVVPSGSRSAEFLRGAGADAMIDSISELPQALERFV